MHHVFSLDNPVYDRNPYIFKIGLTPELLLLLRLLLIYIYIYVYIIIIKIMRTAASSSATLSFCVAASVPGTDMSSVASMA